MTTTEQQKYLAVDANGKATSRRAHLYNDCTTLKSDDGSMKTVGASEIALLGLRVCSVCEKRSSGGPALDILEGFFGEDYPSDIESEGPRAMAWKVIEYLKERNFYIAQRTPKS